MTVSTIDAEPAEQAREARLESIADQLDYHNLALVPLYEERDRLWKEGAAARHKTARLARASRVSPEMIRQARNTKKWKRS